MGEVRGDRGAGGDQHILVAGVANLQTVVPVDGFPIRYEPVRYPSRIESGVGGVGVNVASALRNLGAGVTLCTLIGRDAAGFAIASELEAQGLHGGGVVLADESAQSVVLLAPDGRRLMNPWLAGASSVRYPEEIFAGALDGADLAVLTNAPFVRPLLPLARRAGVDVAVDVHVISDLDDSYNRPWLDLARIVFCSHEGLPCDPVEWIRRMFHRYDQCDVAGIGCGADGCVVATRDGRLVTVPAVAPRGVRNTTGAGDALFAAFLHGWLGTGDLVAAVAGAVLFAGWAVGAPDHGSRLLTAQELDAARTRRPVRAQVGRWSR